ncbi:MAG TPA: PorV/PorQ family protein [Bacteroidetes bacterium]|nr:PorV/PorQ family protein [Bacteroidota bacterium]HIL56391.1 PorV/PorQ family protein [Rhodothermales bacterium]
MTQFLRLVPLALLVAAASAPAAQVLPSYGEDRAGTSGFQFLEVPVDPRGAALGGTAVATADDASALFWNPALITRGGDTQLGAARLEYVADVSLNYVAASQKVGPFTLAAHVQALDSGEMRVTDEFSGPSGTGETFSYLGVSGGLTVAQALTDLFSYGVTAKFVRESAAEVNMDAALLDLGVHYRVGETGAAIGIAIRNFGLNGTASGDLPRETVDGGTVTEDDFEDLVPPTTFLLGMSYDVMTEGDHALTVSGQLTNPNDDSELFNLGAEYVFADLLSLRTGYAFGADERTTPSVGFGLQIPGLGERSLRADYAFSQFDRLGATHRIGLTASL